MASCQLVLPCRGLSREHCSILIDRGEHFIMDLESSNQTYRYNKERIDSIRVSLYRESGTEVLKGCYYLLHLCHVEVMPIRTSL